MTLIITNVKMSLYTLNIKGTEFRVAVISDPQKMKEGLSGKPALGKNKGLLFNFSSEQTVTMNMGGMNYPLDMIFVNTAGEVTAVRTLLPGSFQTTVKNTKYVLEVNKGEGAGFVGEVVTFSKGLLTELDLDEEDEEEGEEGSEEEEEEEENEEDTTGSSPKLNIIVRVITVPNDVKKVFKTGGRFKMYEDAVKADDKAMQVLDDTGKVLMNIVGGERIFSIEHTEEIIALAKRIDRGEAKEEELGKLMKKIIHIQNTQEPQYV